MSDSPVSIWCIVANVIRTLHPEGPEGEMRLGTRLFAPGAKLYCFPPLWGDGGDRLKVLGRHRRGRKFVEAVIPAKLLTDWRPKQVFDPHVVEAMSTYWDDTEKSKALAEETIEAFRSR
jgi:hypothetical protein